MKNEEAIKAYELSINELNHTYEVLFSMYNGIRTKILTFSGAGFALLTFLL